MQTNFYNNSFSISISLSLSCFVLFPQQIMFSLDNLENVWNTLCTYIFFKKPFFIQFGLQPYIEVACIRKKNQQACLASCHFKPPALPSLWTSPGYVPISILVVNYGHVCKFSGMISTLEIFSLLYFIKNEDLVMQKRWGFPKFILKSNYSLCSLLYNQYRNNFLKVQLPVS